MLKSLHDIDSANPDCKICLGCGWVCENHPTKAWADMILEHTCILQTDTMCCCGAGAPCICNRLHPNHQKPD